MSVIKRVQVCFLYYYQFEITTDYTTAMGNVCKDLARL